MDIGWFKEHFIKMVRLCGYTVHKDAIDVYFERLGYEEEEDLLEAFKLMVEDPPQKLNLKHIRSFLSIAKSKDGVATDWSGKECSHCERGLIFTNHFGYSFVWRCRYCRSSNLKFQYHTEDNVYNLVEKMKEDGYTHTRIKEEPILVKNEIQAILPEISGVNK